MTLGEKRAAPVAAGAALTTWANPAASKAYSLSPNGFVVNSLAELMPPLSPSDAEAAAVAALAGLDEALAQGPVTFARYALESLRAGDVRAAQSYAEDLRGILEEQPDSDRLSTIRTVNAWLELNAGELVTMIRELAGMAVPMPQPADTLGDNLVRSLVDRAAAEPAFAQRDALIGEAFGVLAGMPDLAVSRWRAEFSRVLNIGPREFDRMTKSARAGQRVDQAPERQHVPTHDEMGDAWLKGHPLTVFGLGEFRRYLAGYWPIVSDDVVRAEIKAVVESSKPRGVRPTAAVVASVHELARLSVVESDGCWDADPDLLVLTNGTLRLSTGELQPHSPYDRLTTGLDYEYDPGATCPAFRKFLGETVPGAADFLQEFAGYALTTDTRHEIAVWLYGPPGSGKSTFVEGLLAVLGKRAGVLGLADIERSSFALSNLPGKTLMVATEQPADFIRSGHILNALISGEAVNVDRKFRDPVTITPRAKLCWALNDLPRIAEAGSGLFRRVKVVAFPPLSESERDPELKAAIRSEGAGILIWALEGLRRLRVRGRFDIPECVRGATDDFQRRNDVPALFLEECSLKGDDNRTQSSTLYAAYRDWCSANGHRPQSSTAIADEWARLGLAKVRGSAGVFWRGVGLIDRGSGAV